MAYILFRRSDSITAFATISENVVDTTSTSVALVGKRKAPYGEIEQQSKLNMLENFSHSVSPAFAINGQLWHNSVDKQVYVCIDENTQTFEKVHNPLVSPTTPTTNLRNGNFWYNTADRRLYIWNDNTTTFDLVGPSTSVPLSIGEEIFSNIVTSDGTPSEMWVNGVTNSSLVLPVNETWMFEIKLLARRTDTGGEFYGWKFEGIIDNTTNTVSLVGGVATTVIAASPSANYNALISADNTNKSLKINVTGETSKTIRWNATVKLTKNS